MVVYVLHRFIMYYCILYILHIQFTLYILCFIQHCMHKCRRYRTQENLCGWSFLYLRWASVRDRGRARVKGRVRVRSIVNKARTRVRAKVRFTVSVLQRTRTHTFWVHLLMGMSSPAVPCMINA